MNTTLVKRLNRLVQDFFALVANKNVDIYNEFSLQHELGCFLRGELGPEYRVQFERPSNYFGIDSKQLTKKEIDISIIDTSSKAKAAIELKFPRNGQYPEQMFKACQDILFLEELCTVGFYAGLFVIVADDSNFYSPKYKNDGIYSFFRGGIPIHGSIRKPTGKKDLEIHIEGTYSIQWAGVRDSLKYAVVSVQI